MILLNNPKKKNWNIRYKNKRRCWNLEIDLAWEEAIGEVLFPDSNGFIAAARSENERITGMTSGRIPIQAPNPIGVTFEFLNLFQL